MMKHWILRDELYRVYHRWPIMLAFFAIGCLIGWAISWVWPAYFRASSQIHIGLNPYRTYSDVNFLALAKPSYSNIDNYHTWQMAQLDSIIFLDAFIQETLDELRQEDLYWEEIDATQLREILDAEWRTAGKWKLVAKDSNPERAAQVATAWSQVVIRRVKDAVQSSRNTFMIDQELQARADESLQATLRLEELSYTKDALREWSDAAQQLPGNQPLSPTERWHVVSLATRLAVYTPPWMKILQLQPNDNASPKAYAEWISRIMPLIDNETVVLEERIGFLEAERSQLAEKYSSESDKSLGLSPNLEIEGIDHLPPEIVRPTATLTLVGGVIGLLIWVLTQLIMITNRAKEQ